MTQEADVASQRWHFYRPLKKPYKSIMLQHNTHGLKERDRKMLPDKDGICIDLKKHTSQGCILFLQICYNCLVWSCSITSQHATLLGMLSSTYLSELSVDKKCLLNSTGQHMK